MPITDRSGTGLIEDSHRTGRNERRLSIRELALSANSFLRRFELKTLLPKDFLTFRYKTIVMKCICSKKEKTFSHWYERDNNQSYPYALFGLSYLFQMRGKSCSDWGMAAPLVFWCSALWCAGSEAPLASVDSVLAGSQSISWSHASHHFFWVDSQTKDFAIFSPLMPFVSTFDVTANNCLTKHYMHIVIHTLCLTRANKLSQHCAPLLLVSTSANSASDL